jgi:hypothetical protein
MRNTCPYHLTFYFSLFPKLFVFLPFFYLITSFHTFNILNVLAALLKKSISVLSNII